MCAVAVIRQLCQSGMEADSQGDHLGASFFLHQALAQAKGRNSPVLEAKILNTMGVLALLRGDVTAAVKPLSQALEKVVARVGTENALYRVIRKHLDQALDGCADAILEQQLKA